MTDSKLKELATRLHNAHTALADTNQREDQRLIEQAQEFAELAQGAAERIEARAVEAETAEAEMLAYGIEKASEGAVSVPIATQPDPTIWHVAEPIYSNGLDGHQED